MKEMDTVRHRFPKAELAPFSMGAYDIITPSDKPSPGYKTHRALGSGVTPEAAWSDAAKRIMRRPQPKNSEGRNHEQ